MNKIFEKNLRYRKRIIGESVLLFNNEKCFRINNTLEEILIVADGKSKEDIIEYFKNKYSMNNHNLSSLEKTLKQMVDNDILLLK